MLTPGLVSSPNNTSLYLTPLVSRAIRIVGGENTPPTMRLALRRIVGPADYPPPPQNSLCNAGSCLLIVNTWYPHEMHSRN